MQKEIQNIVALLQNGKTILYPTDTIWGLGCDATDEKAAQRIFAIKQRTDKLQMLVLAKDLEMIAQYVKNIPNIAHKLIQETTKPLTLIYPDSRGLAKNIVADDNSIGVRIPKDKFCRELLSQFGKPIVSTSANVSGQPSPVGFADISDTVKQQVDYVVQHRQSEVATQAMPSSIVKLSRDGEMTIIR